MKQGKIKTSNREKRHRIRTHQPAIIAVSDGYYSKGHFTVYAISQYC